MAAISIKHFAHTGVHVVNCLGDNSCGNAQGGAAKPLLELLHRFFLVGRERFLLLPHLRVDISPQRIVKDVQVWASIRQIIGDNTSFGFCIFARSAFVSRRVVVLENFLRRPLLDLLSLTLLTLSRLYLRGTNHFFMTHKHFLLFLFLLRSPETFAGVRLYGKTTI